MGILLTSPFFSSYSFQSSNTRGYSAYDITSSSRIRFSPYFFASIFLLSSKSNGGSSAPGRPFRMVLPLGSVLPFVTFLRISSGKPHGSGMPR